VIIERIAPSLGAEVTGIDLSAMAEADVHRLKETLTDRKLLVFRDQTLSAEHYAAFCRRFGSPVPEDLEVAGRPREVGVIHIRANERQRINFWHMDHSFRELPSAYICLFARTLPPCGGDTLFTSLEAAYAGLDAELQAEISDLHSEHAYTETQNSRRRFSKKDIAKRSVAPPIHHPLVARNPENGRPYLFVNTPVYCRRIVERPDADGDRLLRKLYRHVQRPEFHVRVVWRPGTVVLWENAHCLHYPVADYFPHERLLWRVVVPGALGRPQLYKRA